MATRCAASIVRSGVFASMTRSCCSIPTPRQSPESSATIRTCCSLTILSPARAIDRRTCGTIPAWCVPKAIVVDDAFDWQGDNSPDLALEQLVIYEAGAGRTGRLLPVIGVVLRRRVAGSRVEPRHHGGGALGHRYLPGRQFSRRLVGVEWKIPRHHAALRQGRHRTAG